MGLTQEVSFVQMLRSFSSALIVAIAFRTVRSEEKGSLKAESAIDAVTERVYVTTEAIVRSDRVGSDQQEIQEEIQGSEGTMGKRTTKMVEGLKVFVKGADVAWTQAETIRGRTAVVTKKYKFKCAIAEQRGFYYFDIGMAEEETPKPKPASSASVASVEASVREASPDEAGDAELAALFRSSRDSSLSVDADDAEESIFYPLPQEVSFRAKFGGSHRVSEPLEFPQLEIKESALKASIYKHVAPCMNGGIKNYRYLSLGLNAPKYRTQEGLSKFDKDGQFYYDPTWVPEVVDVGKVVPELAGVDCLDKEHHWWYRDYIWSQSWRLEVEQRPNYASTVLSSQGEVTPIDGLMFCFGLKSELRVQSVAMYRSMNLVEFGYNPSDSRWWDEACFLEHGKETPGFQECMTRKKQEVDFVTTCKGWSSPLDTAKDVPEREKMRFIKLAQQAEIAHHESDFPRQLRHLPGESEERPKKVAITKDGRTPRQLEFSRPGNKAKASTANKDGRVFRLVRESCPAGFEWCVNNEDTETDLAERAIRIDALASSGVTAEESVATSADSPRSDGYDSTDFEEASRLLPDDTPVFSSGEAPRDEALSGEI